MKLIMLPNKKIREKSLNVKLPLTEEKIELIKNMIKHIDDSQLPGAEERAGVGLAAIQVGHLDRMYYICSPLENGHEEWKEFLINPVIIKKKGQIAAENGERCLSVGEEVEGQDGLVHRSLEVTVKGYSYFQNKEITITKKGYDAIIIQHEQDHLNAKLFFDRIDKKKPWIQLDGEKLL